MQFCMTIFFLGGEGNVWVISIRYDFPEKVLQDKNLSGENFYQNIHMPEMENYANNFYKVQIRKEGKNIYPVLIQDNDVLETPKNF